MYSSKIIDSFNGDEHSKAELKLAYQKAFKLGVAVFACLLIIFIPVGIQFASNFQSDLFFMAMSFMIWSFVPPTVLGMFIALLSAQWFARHIIIKLPPAIAPIIEVKRDGS